MRSPLGWAGWVTTLRTRHRRALRGRETREEGGVFDGEVATFPFYKVGLAAPPIHM